MQIYLRHSSIIIHSILFPTELSSISTLQHFHIHPQGDHPFCTDRPLPPSWESCRTGKSFATKGLTKGIKVIVTSQYSPCRSSLIHHVHGLSRFNTFSILTRCLFQVMEIGHAFPTSKYERWMEKDFSFFEKLGFFGSVIIIRGTYGLRCFTRSIVAPTFSVFSKVNMYKS